MEERQYKNNPEVFTKAVRAGKRTYFFDVKSTRDNNLYITVTESKKRFRNDGGFYYEKHKVFLYKEDFVKFADGLQEVVDYVRKNNPTPVKEQSYRGDENEDPEILLAEKNEGGDFNDVDFDELG